MGDVKNKNTIKRKSKKEIYSMQKEFSFPPEHHKYKMDTSFNAWDEVLKGMTEEQLIMYTIPILYDKIFKEFKNEISDHFYNTEVYNSDGDKVDIFDSLYCKLESMTNTYRSPAFEKFVKNFLTEFAKDLKLVKK